MRIGIDCNGIEWEEREVSSFMKDISGEQYGSLTALFPVKDVSKHQSSLWLCQCECGKQVVRNSASLKNKTTRSCGCTRYRNAKLTAMEKHFNNIGKMFGKLTVLEVVDSPEDVKDNRFYYRCICSCGNLVTVRATDLKSGKTISCGCAKRDAEARKREDLTGERFGLLTVISFAYVKDESAYWNCQCDCGSLVTTKGAYLTHGNVASCGCLTSIGESNIKQILNNHNIKYLHNKGYFKDLTSDSGLPLRYDFIIFNDNNDPVRLIEFDGPQHSKPNNLFGEDEFNKLQYHDNLKNQYALSHNIPLVRIPYTKRNTVSFGDLFEDKYLIKGEMNYG